jgi:hypothetical protein
MKPTPYVTAAYKEMTDEVVNQLQSDKLSEERAKVIKDMLINSGSNPYSSMKTYFEQRILDLEIALSADFTSDAHEVARAKDAIALYKRILATTEECQADFERRNKFGVIEGGKTE